MEAKILENDTKQSRKVGFKENENTADDIGVVLKQEEEEQISSCQQISPKSRRKITKPKHYKPTGTEEDDIEHTGFSRTSEDLNGPASSPESVVQDQGDDVIPENAVHVMTSQAMGSSPHGKRSANSQKPKRPGTNKSTGKKRKHEAPTVPRKPEDLIKEAMILGQPTPPASKRDAQYRKSYAYKIWKERGSQEVRSEDSQERNGFNGSKPKLPPGPLQNQARAAFYWPGNQYSGTNPPGFFANGKYYAINPQMIPTVHGRPQLSPTSPTIPQFGKASVTVATSPRAAPGSVIQSSTAGVVSPGQQKHPFRVPVRNSDIENPKSRMAKVIPPNVTVVPQYPQQESFSPRVPKPTPKSPVIRTPPLSKTPGDAKAVSPAQAPERASQTQPPNFENAENGFPAKTSETVESKATSSSTSPSNLVSIMKTSLRQKHSKENVQPLPNMFKSKRKLETDKNDGPASKKAKPTIFTPLNEQEAEKLANDIYDVNLEYFPFQTLAEKAAQSEETLPETPERSEKTKRVTEIEKVRCLLKDFYDVTFSCTEDPDMQKFDSASRKFGRKNILNHLSLLDRYFAELQKKLDT